MKVREKTYLFDGFLNVMLVAFVAMATGFFMGVMAMAGTAALNTVQAIYEACPAYFHAE